MKIQSINCLAICVKSKKLGKNNGKQIRLEEPNDERKGWLNLSVLGLEDTVWVR